ncbi:MAG: heliorhodopsin HeR [Thermoplasmatota archaeon]
MKDNGNGVFRKLRIFNLVMAVLHFLQGLVMVIISNDFTIEVTRGYLDFDPVTERLFPETANVLDIRLGPLIASFLFMSSVAHFLIGTGLYKRYVKDLRKGMNRFRWYEYSISASVMIVAIAMLTGIYDLGTLLLIFFMNLMMILFGLRMEVHNQGREHLDWSPFIYGCIAGVIPWIAIGIHLFGAGGGDGGPPTFVYYIYGSIAVFFNCFAINMVLQYKKVWKWKNYLFGETVYIILSLVAKSLLAWQVFAGTLRPG